MWPSLDERALRLGDETVTYGELLLVGAASGELEQARSDTQRALRVLNAHEDAVGGDELRREAEAFRRQRRLHSGDDLKSWLEKRDLDDSRWSEHLRRSIAYRSDLVASPEPAASNEVEEALIVDLACAGWWGRVAADVVRWWSAERARARREISGTPSLVATDDDRDRAEPPEAVAKRAADVLPKLGTLDVNWCVDRLRVLETRRRAFDEVSASLREHEVVRRRIGEHSSDWMQYVYDELVLPNRTSANEAVMCARDDGLAPEEIASRARVELKRRELRRDQVPMGIAAMLAGAIVGEVVGPFDGDDGVRVVWLRERREPSADDEKIREAAATELLADELDRAAAGKAQVLGPL
ncbi:MAG: hypothetical protein WB770_10860 [Acidimicrobiales bacterium]